MASVLPIRNVYQRLLVRAVYRQRVHYRPLVFESVSQGVRFSYQTLADLFVIRTEEDWMVGGTDMYPNALKLLEQKVTVLKQPVLDGYFISVWPKTQEILVGTLNRADSVAAD